MPSYLCYISSSLHHNILDVFGQGKDLSTLKIGQKIKCWRYYWQLNNANNNNDYGITHPKYPHWKKKYTIANAAYVHFNMVGVYHVHKILVICAYDFQYQTVNILPTPHTSGEFTPLALQESTYQN